ncbi:MAG: cation:proton antiporter [Pseudomonadota bacterium]
MQIGVITVLVGCIAYAMVAHRLSRSIVTAPMVFLALGFGISAFGIIDGEQMHQAESLLHTVAEIALIVLLFLDASQINVAQLRSQSVWPFRMLVFGMPLMMLFGTLSAVLFFPDWPLTVLALVAAILAPTDAALGQAVISNPAVPEKERQSLTVESGLNDGLALPFILFFASLVAMHMDADGERMSWLLFGAKQIILGPLVGGLVGWGGAKLFVAAEARALTESTFEGIAILALAGVAYLSAAQVGGNGFIAAFVAGLAFGNVAAEHCRFIYEFTETEGQLLIWVSFLFIGMGLLPNALAHLDWTMAVYILLSLLVLRPLAIYLSLLGTRASALTRLFFGWFGPRGLATALFALLVVHEAGHEYADTILIIAINAVWISALLHGITAAPGANWYATRSKDEC